MSAPNSMSAAFRDYAWLSVTRLSLVPITLLTVRLLTEVLGLQGYGSLALVLSVVQVSAWVIGDWTAVAYVRFARETLERQGTLAPVFWSRLLLLGALTGVGAIASWLLEAEVQGYTASAVPWYGITGLIGITVGSSVALSSLNTLSAMRPYALLALLDRLTYALGLVGLMVAGQRELGAVLAVYFVGKAVVCIGALVVVKLTRIWPPVLSGHAMWRIVSYSWTNLLVPGYLFEAMQLWVIRHYLSLSAVSLYSVAYQWMILTTAISAAGGTVTLPILVSWRVQQKQAQLRQVAERVLPGFAWAGTLVVMLGAAVVAPLVPLVFGEPFAQVEAMIWIFAIGSAYQFPLTIETALLAAYDMIAHTNLVTLTMTVWVLLGLLVAVPLLGERGAAWVVALAYPLAATMSAALIQWRTGFRLWSGLVPPLLLVLPCLAAAWLPGPFAAPVIAALTCAVTLLVLRRTRLISAIDLELLEQLRLPRPLTRAVRAVLGARG